jgi:hypothetical protein
MTSLGRIAATALLALAALPVTAENRAAEAFSDKLAGTWQGQGEVRQMSADMRMQ